MRKVCATIVAVFGLAITLACDGEPGPVLLGLAFFGLGAALLFD